MNLLLFVFDPYSSRWHYSSHDPVPIQVVQPNDSNLTVGQIIRELDSIDLAYGARERSTIEEIQAIASKALAFAFLPSTIALMATDFFGYMGPANPQQRAFTLSVKKRYNHLARLGVRKGMNKDGYLFQEDESLGKKRGESFISLR